MRWMVSVALLLTACASSSDPVVSDPVVSDPTPAAPTSITSESAGTAPSGTEETVNPTVAAGVNPSSTGTADDTAVRPEGFTTTLARATMPDGAVCEICVWLADTPQQRSRGLMFVTDLGVADAMAFRYPEPHTGTFWMKNTLLPLSIAFFAPDGGFLTAFDMEPCTSDPCPNYRTADDFSIAVEVRQGELGDLGLVEGSVFELLDLPCTP